MKHFKLSPKEIFETGFPHTFDEVKGMTETMVSYKEVQTDAFLHLYTHFQMDDGKIQLRPSFFNECDKDVLMFFLNQDRQLTESMRCEMLSYLRTELDPLFGKMFEVAKADIQLAKAA